MSQHLKKSKWALIESALSVALPALSLILMARLLEPRDYGLFGLMWALLGPLWVLLECFFSDYLLLRSDMQKDSSFIRSAYGATLMGAGALIGVLLLGATSTFPGEGQQAFVVLSLGLFLPALYCIPQALAFRSASFKMLAGRTLIGRLLALLFGAVLASRGLGVWSLVAIQLVNGLVSLIAIIWVKEFRVRPAFSLTPLHGHWSFLMKLGLNNALSMYGKRVFILLLAGTASLETIGRVEMATRIVDMIQSVFTGFAKRLALPIFMKPGLPEKEQEHRYWSLTTLTATAAMSVYSVLIAAWGWVLPTFLGAKWLEAGLIVVFFSLAAGIQSLRFFNYDLANLRGRPGVNLINQVLMFSASFLAGLSITQDSPSHVGAAWLLANLLMFVLSTGVFRLSGVVTSWRAGLRGVGVIAASSLAAALLAIWWPQQGHWSMAAGLLMLGLHGALAMALTRPAWQRIREIARSDSQ